MKKFWYSFIAIIAIVVVILIFYTNPSSSDNKESQNGNPQYGGSIIIGISGDLESLNPLFSESTNAQEINHLLLLGLADLDENSNFTPELAESWEHSEDNLRLTYNLRKNVGWSDGVPFSAEDVKFTYDLLMDDDVASPRQGVTEYIKEVIVNDPHTVTFVFKEAYPAQLFDTAGEILPKHILKDVDRKALRTHEFGRNPISSGPYKLGKWTSQQYIELVPNEMYYGDKPYLNRLVFKIIPDKTNQLMQLKSGEIDMMVGVPPAEIENLLKENQQLEIHHVDGRVYYYIAYNQKNELFNNTSVRRALTMATDRNKIIQALLYGYGRPCLGPLPPMVKWAYNDEVDEIPFNPEKASTILEKQGWTDTNGDGWIDKDGRIFEFTLKTSTGNQIKSDVCVIVQEQLSKVGIKVNIEKVEWTTLINQLQSKDFDACVNGWSTSYYIDPTPIFHSTATNLFNFISYNNSDVDRLIETGREEMNIEKASIIWKEFQEIIYQDQPYTFLFWIDKAIAVNNRIKNATPIALSSVYNIEKWFISTGEIVNSDL